MQKLNRTDTATNNYHAVYGNMNENNEELYVLQQKILFYKDAISKQKNQMDNLFNVRK